MGQVWVRWGTVLVTTAMAVPLTAGVVWGLAANRRRRGASKTTAWRNTATEVCAVAGTIPWLWMVTTPKAGDRVVSWVPFADLAELAHAPVPTIVVQLVGNLLVFAAAGFCLPVRFGMRHATVAALAAGGSILIETTQYVADIGRVSSIDDVLVNTCGAALAAWASRRWWRRSVPAVAPV